MDVNTPIRRIRCGLISKPFAAAIPTAIGMEIMSADTQNLFFLHRLKLKRVDFTV